MKVVRTGKVAVIFQPEDEQRHTEFIQVVEVRLLWSQIILTRLAGMLCKRFLPVWGFGSKGRRFDVECLLVMADRDCCVLGLCRVLGTVRVERTQVVVLVRLYDRTASGAAAGSLERHQRKWYEAGLVGGGAGSSS